MDRNTPVCPGATSATQSLSARRAWIEIPVPPALHQRHAVALRKESVDRNCVYSPNEEEGSVALRKESVDRNGLRGAVVGGCLGRSPQGERG